MSNEHIKFNVPIPLPSDVTLNVEGVVMPAAGRVAVDFSATYPAALGSISVGYVQGILSHGVKVNLDGAMEIDGYILLESQGADGQQKVKMEIFVTKDGYSLGRWNGTLVELPVGVKVAPGDDGRKERERGGAKLSEFKIRQPSPPRSALDIARSMPQVTTRFEQEIALQNEIKLMIEGIVQQPSSTFAADLSATYPGALGTVSLGHIKGEILRGVKVRVQGPLEVNGTVYYADMVGARDRGGDGAVPLTKVMMDISVVRDGRVVQRWDGQVCELPPPPPVPARDERRRRR